MEHAILHRTFPHQTGVTKRSIRDDDWYSGQLVVKHMVIRHLDDRVGTSVIAEMNRHDHLAGIELGILRG